MVQIGAEQVEPSDAFGLEAQYTANSYPISYELDGGVNAAENPSSYTVDDGVRLRPATRDGYTFGGWYLDAAHEQPTNTVPLNHLGPITFYAAWDIASDQGQSQYQGQQKQSASVDSSATNRKTLAATGEQPWESACLVLAACGLALALRGNVKRIA